MSSERHHPKTIQEIKEIQATVAEAGYRRLQTDAEKVRYLKKFGFSFTSITEATKMKKGNVKRYFYNPKATSVRGNPYLTTEEEHLLVGVILTRVKTTTLSTATKSVPLPGKSQAIENLKTDHWKYQARVGYTCF